MAGYDKAFCKRDFFVGKQLNVAKHVASKEFEKYWRETIFYERLAEVGRGSPTV